MKIELIWSDFKIDIINKGFVINYKKIYNDSLNPNNYGYEIFAIDRSLEWVSILTSSGDIVDFETNYKILANQYVEDLLRTNYKSNEIEVTDSWQVIDFEDYYYDLSLNLSGDKDIEIKLNLDTNDIIKLTTRFNVIEPQSLKVKKIYYKTKDIGVTSKLFYFAIK